MQTAFDLGGPPPAQEHLSQHFTDRVLARQIVDWSVKGIRRGPGERHPSEWDVLEPTAGSGAFVEPMLERFGKVTVVEIDPAWSKWLESRSSGACVVEADYLTLVPPAALYDLAIMNPPYEGGQDGKFLAKAMDESVRVVALTRVNVLLGKDRYQRIWRRVHSGEWWLGGLVILESRPRFWGAKERETNGNPGSPRHDFCVVKLTRHAAEVGREFQPEWW